ncbi:MAG: hypothetical protein NW703_06735 [Nitrospiraceae bacterium]
MNELDDGGVSRCSHLLHQCCRLIVIAVLVGGTGCVAPTNVSTPTSYAEAKQRYLQALEQDLDLTEQYSRLVSIPSFAEPSPPGAVFKKGNPRPLNTACIVAPDQRPAPQHVPELWPSGSPPRFKLVEEELPLFMNVAVQRIPRIKLAVAQSAPAMYILADTTQVVVSAEILKRALRNEACLQAILGHEILIVRGLLSGSEAVTNSRYFDPGSGEEVLKNEHVRVVYDGSGHFYVQETDPKPKYWAVSAWKASISVVPEPKTPEQRTVALKSLLDSSHGTLVVIERTPTDQDLQYFLDDLASLTKRRTK